MELPVANKKEDVPLNRTRLPHAMALLMAFVGVSPFVKAKEWRKVQSADPLLRQLANINVLLFRLNGTLLAQYEALADIHTHLEQQAEEPPAAPEAPPAAAQLYQTIPPPEAEYESSSAVPPHQPKGQTFTDLFKKKK